MMRRVVYILILIVAAIFYPLYEGILSLTLLAALIVLPFVSLAEMLIRRKKLVVSGAFSEGKTSVIHKGDSAGEDVVIQNPSLFPTSGEICFVTKNHPYGGDGEEIVQDIAVPSRSDARFTALVSSLHCGVVETELKYLKIHDILGLFTAKVVTDGGTVSTYIIPHISEEYEEEARSIKAARPSESDSEEDMRPTTSPGDVIDFRDFRPGDRMTLIHHKLSARFDKDIVKIMGASGEQKYLLCAELDGADPSQRDEILAHVISCAYYLDMLGAEVLVSAPDVIKDMKDGIDAIACGLVCADSIPQRSLPGAVSVMIGQQDL